MNGHTNGSSSTTIKEDRRPILVRLDGLAQTNDMLAIREMGRQIAIGQGGRANDGNVGDDDDDETEDAVQAAEVSLPAVSVKLPPVLVNLTGIVAKNAAPTTLPAHLLAHLTAPSSRAIVIVIENFDLFTNHARQALLYCLCE
jgi:origin recognition complex subunit 4